MAHNHNHSHSHSHSHTSSGDNASKNIGIAFWLNVFFSIFELVGGLITNSVAILSDALHDFGDSISLGVSWLLQKKSSQKGDSKFSYGYKRFSLLGSIFLSGVLVVSSVFIITEAVKRIISPEVVNAKGMFIFAIAGIVINGSAALRLKKGSTLNERAVFLHIMEDVLGWVAVLIAGVVMIFADIPILDPILSVAITVWVLSNVYRNLKDTFKILLQATPEDIDPEEVHKDIEKIEGVTSIHDLHIWTLDGESHVMTLHAVVENTESADEIKEMIRKVASEHHIEHVTTEVEDPERGAECEYSTGEKN